MSRTTCLFTRFKESFQLDAIALFSLLLVILLAIWWTPVFWFKNNEAWRRRIGSALFLVNLPFYYFMVAPSYLVQPHLADGLAATIVHYSGLAIFLYGLAMSFWTIPYKIKAGGPGYDPCKLLQEGVFGLVRHPQMSGALAISFGVACWNLAVWHLWLTVVYAAILYGQIWMEEKYLLIPHFGAQYHEYRQKVKAFVPFIF